MRKTTRWSVRFSLETPEDVAFLSDLSALPPGKRNRWLRTLTFLGSRIPANGGSVPEPSGPGRGVRMDLAGDTPEERDLLSRVRRDFYPGKTLRECLLRGWLLGKAPSGEREKAPPGQEASLSAPLLPSGGSVQEKLRGLL